MILGAALYVAEGKSERHLPIALADKWQGQLSEAHALGSSLPVPLPPVSGLLCCPGEVQGLISRVLQLVRGKAGIPASMMPRW